MRPLRTTNQQIYKSETTSLLAAPPKCNRMGAACLALTKKDCNTPACRQFRQGPRGWRSANRLTQRGGAADVCTGAELQYSSRIRFLKQNLEARGRIELPMKVLQTLALPLGDRAVSTTQLLVGNSDALIVSRISGRSAAIWMPGTKRRFPSRNIDAVFCFLYDEIGSGG
jgi:hypothetical protein